MMVYIICDYLGAPVKAFSTLKAAQFYAGSLRDQDYSIVKLAVD